MTKISDVPGFAKAKEIATQWNERLTKFREIGGLEINDVVAMSPGNDPFWMTAGKVLKAIWASRVMKDKIIPHLKRNDLMGKGIHLRDIHYILTGMNYDIWNGSEKYQNTDAHWNDLLTAFANARYLGLVDPNLIRDNKNEYNERTKYRSDWAFDLRIERGKRDLSKEMVLDLFTSWFRNLKNWQNHMPVHIELWAEKDLAILDQIADKYKINTVIGEGETSITQVYQIIERIKEAGKPVRIAYIADCDVVGSNMSKAMARKMEFIMHLEEEGLDVKLTHLMLTPTQVKYYDLPTTPMKTKVDAKTKSYETRKEAWMDARDLPGAVEINSFHALYPDDFRRIIEDFILSFYDKNIRDLVINFNDEQEERINAIVSDDENISSLIEESLEKLKEAIDKIDWIEQESDYDEEFEDMLEENGVFDYSERDVHFQWLLDTDIDYVEQLARYRDYENGELDNEIEE